MKPSTFSLSVLLLPFSLLQAAQPAKPGPIPTEEAIVLSPFQVTADSEQGYLATQTLSGTRFKTDLKDLGSALTIFTEQMMDDLGANSINDLIAFAPNTDPALIGLTDTTVLGNNFINQPTEYVTRGGTTSVVGQDFFDNGIPNDRFNSEALTFTRGPNAILFGLGNASGAFVSSTKRAKYKTATTVEGQVDDRGSFRYTIDHNHVIIKDRLAVRFAGLYDAPNSFRFPAESLQRRQFYTVRLTPFKKTNIRANYETGYIHRVAIRPWPAYDNVIPWIDRGSTLFPVHTGLAIGKSAATGTLNYAFAGLVSTEFSPGGTVIPTQSLTNQAATLGARYSDGYPVVGANRRSLMRADIYPLFATGYGGAYQDFDYRITSIFLEQEITRNFFIEAAVNQVKNDSVALNSGSGDAVQADPNVELPGHLPNPNVGKLYTEGPASIIERPSTSLTQRVMASYELDFTNNKSKWIRLLGSHRLAAFYEHGASESYSSNNGIRNVTPLARTGAAAEIGNAANVINYRYYYDPAAGKVGNTGIEFSRYPSIYANNPLPATGANGITPAFVAIQGGNATDSVIKTKALALQSNFWKSKLVLTNGWRTDDTTTYRAVPDDYVALRDARGIAPDPARINTRSVASNFAERGGHTYSRGVVYHALPWMSLTWNTSDNFQANDSTRDIFGNLLPNPKGKGSDYGLKFALLDRRLFLEIVYYTNSTIDKFDSVGGVASFSTHFNQIWDNVAAFTNNPKYSSAPYSASGTGWSDNATSSSQGYEFSLTANPLKSWRITLNGSKRGHSTTTARGTRVETYIAQYIPVIKSHPEWQGITTTNGLTVASRVATIEEALVNFKALRNQPEDIYSPTWSLNLVQNYAFAADGRLKGFSLGQTMSARGPAINGFAEDANQVLDPGAPYVGSSTLTFGGMASYQRRLFHNRITWKLQVNVRNLFNHDVVIPLRAVDSRDGQHTHASAIYTIREPRTYQFTSTFKF